MARRVEPTVFLAMVSPVTVLLVAGTVALVVLVTGSWLAAAAAAAVVWSARVFVATRFARRIQALPRRIDPFALREPWRFFVRDAMRARSRFAEAIADARDGPLRDRLAEIGRSLDDGVEHAWEAAQRGQQLTDARRRIDADPLRRQLEASPDDDPRRPSISAQLESHDRLQAREEATRLELERLELRLDEAVARATELGTRSGAVDDLEAVGHSIGSVVSDLEALRLGLDDIEGRP